MKTRTAIKHRLLRVYIYPLLIAAGLSSCAVSPSHYYSLSAADKPVDRPKQTSLTAPYAVEVAPVVVPAEVDRPQIVVNDQDSSRVIPLSSSLWASPLNSQIRNTLSNSLAAQLGVPTLVSSVVPEGVAAWRVSFQVHRFESAYDDYVLLDASWQLTPINLDKARHGVLCRASAKVSVEPGMSALVQGHNQALQRFAKAIATQIGGTTIAPDAGLTNPGCT